MLQIRLSKGPSSDGGGGPARASPPVESVTVACPEHLVIADLPVAKSIGLFIAASVSSGRNMGRRSRRQLGDRIHFCVRCDFPIAIYGRLIPCEHAFCLACARSDPSCYLCDERVQKIQTIKMLEGIFICAAPHCLKSFLKKAEFESHVHDTHTDLLQPNGEKEGGSETNNFNVIRPPSAELQKQSLLPEASTARAPPPRSGFSPSSNSQPQDREDRTHHRYPSRDHPYLRPPQFRPLLESNGPPIESMFSNMAAQIPHHASYQMGGNLNQPIMTAPFNFSHFTADVPQPFFAAPFEMNRPESVLTDGGFEQGLVMGIPTAPTGATGFREIYLRPFGKESEQQSGSENHNVASLPGQQMQNPLQLPPPPPLPPPLSAHLNRLRFLDSGDAARDGQSTMWQNDKGMLGNWPEQ